jgi:hypothetical protein
MPVTRTTLNGLQATLAMLQVLNAGIAEALSVVHSVRMYAFVAPGTRPIMRWRNTGI